MGGLARRSPWRGAPGASGDPVGGRFGTLRALHLLGAQHHGVGISGKGWGVLGSGPDNRLEELAERQCSLVGVELEIHDDIARVIDRSQHAMGAHAGIVPCVSESVEGSRPGLEVGDRVLNVKDRHGCNIRPLNLDRR